MTKELLKQLIREMVREEVRECVPQILSEIFSSKVSNVVSESPRPVKTSLPVRTPPSVVKKEYKTYVKDERINKVLNETSVSIPRDVPLVTGGMNEIGSSGGSILDHAEQMPEPIAKAITRDYSALMKAIDKRRSK